MVQNQTLRILEALLREDPKFHGRDMAGTQNYAIHPMVLEWMATKLSVGIRTFETGCGYTTILLASLASKHTVISPFPEEHELIRSWCASHGIPTDHVEFIAKPSQEVVPNLPHQPLDFVLIDGDHAFPAPFIDWYYMADMLRVGGHVAVDDTQIPTGGILRQFLLQESGRWSLASELGKTSIFTRVTDLHVAKGVMWDQQPFCRIPKGH